MSTAAAASRLASAIDIASANAELERGGEQSESRAQHAR